MDNFDNFSENNIPEQNNDNPATENFSNNSNVVKNEKDSTSTENIYCDGFVNSCEKNEDDNLSDGTEYRNQTPPYYYGQNSDSNSNNVNPYSNYQSYNSNPYSSGQHLDNRDPYPYANYTNSGSSVSGPDNNNSGKKNIKIIIAVVAALIVILLGIVIGIVLNSNSVTTGTNSTNEAETVTESNVEDAVTQSTPVDASSNNSDDLSAKDVYEKICDASVGVIVYENSSDTESGEGSGVLLKEDKDGKYTYIITCAHVISGAKKAVVQLSDNTEYAADIIGADSRTDIGVLRIEAHGLTLAEIGDSEKISVGDPVYAIGNPGGTSFAGSFTDGMISALDRPVNSETGYTMKCIQHTAAINPGNSGGALVNAYGQLIGINSSKIVSEDYEGMGFSVPSSVFVEIFNSIVTNGYVTDRAKLGITYVAASEYNNYYGMYIAIKGLPSGSLVVYSISSDSDLVNTDVKEGDLIVSVNGKELDDSSILAEAVENGSVGDTLTLGIVRINENYSSEEFEVKVKLVEDKDGTSASTEETTTQEYSMEDYFKQYFGDSYDDYSGSYYGYGGGSSSGGNFGW